MDLALFNQKISIDKLTVVDYYADWCGPCKAIAPRFEALTRKYPNIQFLKINTDDSKDVSQDQGITAMPTFKFYRKGKLVETVVGADIVKVERLCEQLGGGAGAGGFTGKGQTLSGKTVGTKSEWSVNPVYVVLAVFVAFLYFTAPKK